MKRIAILVGILSLATVAAAAFETGEPQGPQMPAGGFRVIQAVESTWAALAFEVKVDSATLEKARPHFQIAWEKRKKLVTDSRGDFRAVADGMTKIKADLDQALKAVLTEKQLKQLAEWEKSQQQGPMRGMDRPDRGREPR